MTRTRTLSAVAASAAALLAGTSLTAADAASNSYVALGDSYSAGVGTKSKVDSCYRSTFGYPALIAAAKGLALNYQACSGATVADVQNNQLGALNSTTGYVSITIGGNDVGFASVLTECAKPAWMSDCQTKINGGLNILRGQMPARYDSLFSSIRSKAPNAKVVVASYPRIFNGEDCNALTWFSPQEQTSLNSATDELDTLLLGKATSRGFGTVDVRSSFNTHRVCDTTEWINGLSYPIEESYHPNRAGNQSYAALVAPKLVGSTLRTSTASTSDSARTGAQPATEPPFSLTSPESIAGAKKVGINPAELKRLDADLRSGDGVRVQSATKRVKQLDAMAEAKLRS
ncbi:SGNH/GDSL hydrolase family protein [Yimella sp. cx-51]|uniref:SGNH/GDSL hydrolase family protein n=1 Tax=Yimella sp. cx-51 TaxID=2770551 RepID=UPI00165E82AC|nr:SGNH/GDSL hydrolase family protein [Yimella sp. cx-51]MBC9955598.1 SGNH/GDSL hydrolase family protein [Yimella sp. cx-51]QTH37826.1 SGNH/GDSL hydrolase family protein [Yimella sp. cx-51]